MTDWQDIRWLEAVLRHGSFSEAARAEGTTQATISRRIKALESKLGAALFVRGLEGAAPTELARSLAGPAADMRTAAERFERQLTERRSGRRRIALTCGELIGGFLSKRLSVLGEGLEGAEIELRPTNAFVDLTKGEADLALRNKRPASGPLKARRLKAEGYGRFSVFGAAEHYSEHQLETLEELRGEAWIALATTMAHLPSATWVAEHIGEEAVRFRMNSTALVLEATHHNRALALLPRFIGLDAEHLVEVYGPVEDMLFEMWVVRRDEEHADPVMDRLIGNIERVLSRVPGSEPRR